MKKALAVHANATRPIIKMETMVVNELVAGKSPLTKPESDLLLYALAFSKLRVLRVAGKDVFLGHALAEGENLPAFRARLVDALKSVILENHGSIDYDELRRLMPRLAADLRKLESRLLASHINDFSKAHLEAELMTKDLTLVLGGGGGAGYVYLGAFAALEQAGVTPSYLVGTSMGSIMAVLRGINRKFSTEFALDTMRGLRWRDVFRLMTTENHYGLPATLRLYLHDALQHRFTFDGGPLRLDHMEIPTEVIVAGIKKGRLPHDMDYYENLLDFSGVPGPMQVFSFRRRIGKLYESLREFLTDPTVLREVVLGRDDLTKSFDALDAVGFSSAIPGVLHYDVFRKDTRMHSLLTELMRRHNLLRLIDGGVVANVPARSAWRGVQEGKTGKRNTFILALDCFAPSFNSNVLFSPIQHLLQTNVKRDRPYAHFTKAFHDVLSPLSLIPKYEKVIQAVVKGKRALERDLPFIEKMLEPIQTPDFYQSQGANFEDDPVPA